MLILGTFPDRTTRIQTLMRVGRFGDKCKRIRDTKFKEVDEEKDAERKGEIEKTLRKVVTDKAKAMKMGNMPLNSPTEFKDKHLTNK